MHLSLITSLDSQCRSGAARMAGRGHPDSVLVFHDLLPEGRVLRRVMFRDRWIDRRERLLEHGCLSCTVRLDVVPTVREFLRAGCPHLLLALPPGVGAAQVLEELRQGIPSGLDVDNLLVAVDPAELEEHIWDPRSLYQAGFTALPGDDRISGEFLIEEFALSDTVLALPGMSSALREPEGEPVIGHDAASASAGTQGMWLLGHLAPHATVLSRGDEFQPGCHDQGEARSRSRPGAVRVPVLDDPGTFRTVLHRLDRPLHPVRLHEALPRLAQGVHWMRGAFRVAGLGERPLALQGVGPRVWLEPAEAAPSPAVLRGHGEGRDGGLVALTGRADDVDGRDLERLLGPCRLTDAEMLQDRSGFPDPFGLSGLS